MIENVIEKRVIDYIANAVGLPAYAEMPEPNEGQFLVVEKTGSTKENLIDSATMVVQSYADSKYEAAMLNNRVKDAMFDMVFEPNISAVRLNSDYDFTDTSTKRYRYQAVFVVTYY